MPERGGELVGRRVIVTGAASGIGRAVTGEARRQGADVALIDRSEKGVAALAAETGCPYAVADVSVTAQVDAAVAGLVGSLGGLDGLVCSAGVGALAPLARVDDRTFARVVGVNLTGTFACLRAAEPYLAVGRGSSVVTLASVSAVRPTFGEGPYSAAKAGVVALTMAAALEWAPRVRVNCVSPGFIRTPMNEMLFADREAIAEITDGTPLERAGDVAEVASVVCFLLSDRSSYMTGHNLVVDGGSLLPSPQVEHTLRRWSASLGGEVALD